MKPEPEPELLVPKLDPAQFMDAELAAKAPRDRRRREGFSFVQAGKLQRDAEVMRLRVRAQQVPPGCRWHVRAGSGAGFVDYCYETATVPRMARLPVVLGSVRSM